jgi:hypothetical protein
MRRITWLLCFAATTALCSAAFGETAGPDIVSGPAAASKLEIRGLEVGSDGAVSGTVVNASGGAIKDVELRVSHVWSWTDERYPGEDNPGRASVIRVTGPLSDSGSLPFAYAPNPPLPTRADGIFQTSVAVQSFTEIEN